MSPSHDPSARNYDIIFIGAGPAGLAGARRAVDLGMRVALIERGVLGGGFRTSVIFRALFFGASLFRSAQHGRAFGLKLDAVLDYGALRTKALAASRRWEALVRSDLALQGVELIEGEAHLTGEQDVWVRTESGNEHHLRALHIIVATGSRPQRPANLVPDGQRILTPDEALLLEEVPARVCIVGAGATGCELAAYYASLGSHVVLLERQGMILPGWDVDLSRALMESFASKDIRVHTRSEAHGVRRVVEGVEVHFGEGRREGRAHGDVVVLATGRAPNTDRLGLDKAGVRLGSEGTIEVDSEFCTAVEGVFAVGDVVHGASLSSLAAAESVWVVERLAGLDVTAIDAAKIPVVLCTAPEVATVGLPEHVAREKYGALPRHRAELWRAAEAVAQDAEEGFVKLVVRPDGKMLGAHAVGLRAGEAIQPAALALQCELPLERLTAPWYAYASMASLLAASVTRGSDGPATRDE